MFNNVYPTLDVIEYEVNETVNGRQQNFQNFEMKYLENEESFVKTVNDVIQ